MGSVSSTLPSESLEHVAQIVSNALDVIVAEEAYFDTTSIMVRDVDVHQPILAIPCTSEEVHSIHHIIELVFAIYFEMYPKSYTFIKLKTTPQHCYAYKDPHRVKGDILSWFVIDLQQSWYWHLRHLHTSRIISYMHSFTRHVLIELFRGWKKTINSQELFNRPHKNTQVYVKDFKESYTGVSYLIHNVCKLVISYHGIAPRINDIPTIMASSMYIRDGKIVDETTVYIAAHASLDLQNLFGSEFSCWHMLIVEDCRTCNTPKN
jgi:hypothetical protein